VVVAAEQHGDLDDHEQREQRHQRGQREQPLRTGEPRAAGGSGGRRAAGARDRERPAQRRHGRQRDGAPDRRVDLDVARQRAVHDLRECRVGGREQRHEHREQCRREQPAAQHRPHARAVGPAHRPAERGDHGDRAEQRAPGRVHEPGDDLAPARPTRRGQRREHRRRDQAGDPHPVGIAQRRHRGEGSRQRPQRQGVGAGRHAECGGQPAQRDPEQRQSQAGRHAHQRDRREHAQRRHGRRVPARRDAPGRAELRRERRRHGQQGSSGLAAGTFGLRAHAGSSTTIRHPAGSRPSARIAPPWASTIQRAIDSPRPLPAPLRAASAR